MKIFCIDEYLERFGFQNQKRKHTSVVYHYAFPAKFESIITNGKIRFTNIRDFDDKLEYIYSDKLFRKVYKKLKSKLYFKDINKVFNKKYDFCNIFNEKAPTFTDEPNYINSNQQNAYVFCATKLPNSPRMWKNYAKDYGYNFSLKIKNLVDCLSSTFNNFQCTKIFHGNVFYDKRQQIEIIKKIIINIDNSFREDYKLLNEKQKLFQAQLMFYQEMLMIRPFIKRRKFRQEKEYRFVILHFNLNGEEKGVHFYQLEFDKQETISEMTISPKSKDLLVKKNLQQLLYLNGYGQNIKIKNQE